jgi:DNA (cytosine-5)-methyltransferase 1
MSGHRCVQMSDRHDPDHAHESLKSSNWYDPSSDLGDSPTLRTVDLFAGCGGMSLGFQQAGFKIVAAFDHWLPAVEVYTQNFSHPAKLADLGDPAIIPEIVRLSPDVIIGGPPCQDFSSAGPLQSGGKRANLTRAYADIVILSRPRYFVFENVPRARFSEVFLDAKRAFKEAGYGLTEVQLDAAFCGVPQSRKRLFLIGCLGQVDAFLEKSLASSLSKKPLTMREYLGNEIDIDHYFRVPTNYSRRGVFSVDEPCATVRAVDRPVPRGYPGHKDDTAPINGSLRGLTVLERSRIQTFPKDFKFVGNKTNLNTLIGNAVPVNLAKYVATKIKNFESDLGQL